MRQILFGLPVERGPLGVHLELLRRAVDSACHDGTLWPDVAHRRAANPRDWDTDGGRRASWGCPSGGVTRIARNAGPGCAAWSSGYACIGPLPGQLLVWHRLLRPH